jgi:hypothetical protein
MISKQMEEDFETLLSVEIKLRLLDTEGVDISKEPPVIPPEPEVYFYCHTLDKLLNFANFFSGLRIQFRRINFLSAKIIALIFRCQSTFSYLNLLILEEF